MLTYAEELPARVVPPTEPMSTVRYLRTVVRNPLEVWPDAIYRQPIFADRMLGQDTLFVMDPELVERMLIDEPERYAKSDMMKRLLAPALGNGMLNADGLDWRRQRRIVAPAFRPDRIAGYVATMLAAGEREADRLSSLPDGAPVQLLHEMMQTTFEVVAETILSGADRLDIPAVEHAIGDYLGGTGWVVALSQLGLPRGFPYPGKRRVTRARDYLRRITSEMVAERRRQGSRPDLIQALIDARDEETGEGISDTEIVDNLLTFIAAGHETTALALTWTLYLLSLHPDAEAKVLAEIARATGPRGLAPEAVAGLAYTRQVIQEAMRLYPPAPSLLREPVAAGEIAGHKITPKTSIFIPIYAIHRHRALWGDPDRFDPDRFEPQVAKARHRCAYLPFGGGPRICIGMGFSLLEAAAILATILPRFRLEPAGEPPVPVAQITLRPKTGMPMVLRRRAEAPAKAA
jgi:cytochrome P450